MLSFQRPPLQGKIPAYFAPEDPLPSSLVMLLVQAWSHDRVQPWRLPYQSSPVILSYQGP